MSRFLINDAAAMRKWVLQEGFAVHLWDGAASWTADDITRTLTLAAEHRCAAVVVDSDFEGEAYLRRLRAEGLVVCAIEDLAPHAFPCQLVVNGDIHARLLSYISSSKDTRFLLGPEYAILRREFWRPQNRVTRDQVENVLVVFGGSDHYGLTPKVVAALDRLPSRFSMTVIIGPLHENRDEVKEAARRARRHVRMVYAPDSVGDLMLGADVAVSAGGQTLYELAWAGCPTVAISTAVNQDEQVRVFEQLGFVRWVGNGSNPGVADQVAEAVAILAAGQSTREQMCRSGQRLIDGRGAIRVAHSILAQVQ